MRLLQQGAHLVVAGLRKFLVPEAHSPKRLRHRGTDEFIGLGPQLPASVFGTHRHGDHQASRVLLGHRQQGRAHGRAARQSIIHHDDGAPTRADGGTLAAVKLLAPHQLTLLTRHHLGQGLGRYVDANQRVHHAHAAAGQRTHGKFFMAGQAQLAHHHHIQRRLQRAGHFIRHDHTAARQGSSNRCVAPGTMANCFSQRRCAKACSLSSITPWSAPPTISSVGAVTVARATGPARSGRPPRDTTAAACGPKRAATISAAGTGAKIANRHLP